MSSHFTHRFEVPHPTNEREQRQERYRGMPLLEEIEDDAAGSIVESRVFNELPERNKELLLDMSGYVIRAANSLVALGHAYDRENYWGLYVIGSRSRGEHGTDSDLDLLSVGTLYGRLGFMETNASLGRSEVFRDFITEIPDELPDEYNVGEVSRKYLIRATPQNEGILPVDLNVVDMTFIPADLYSFRTTHDTDTDGSELERVPLVEVTVAQADSFIRNMY